MLVRINFDDEFFKTEDGKKAISYLAKSDYDFIHLGIITSCNADEEILKYIAKREDLSPIVYETIAKTSNDEIKEILAANKAAISTVEKKLFYEQDKKVLIKIARNPNTEGDILTALFLHDDFHVREAVAENPNTPPEVVNELVLDKEFGVFSAALSNPNVDSKKLREFYNNEDYIIREYVAKNPSLPVNIIKILAEDKEWSVRETIARNVSTPCEILDRLSCDKVAYVRIAVAYNPNTLSKTLDRLTNDEEFHVRVAVAKHKNASEEALFKLAGEYSLYSRSVNLAVLDNPNSTVKVFDRLIRNNCLDWFFLKKIAEKDGIPAEILEKLSQENTELEVKLAIIENSNVSIETLKTLSRDRKYEAIRDAALEKMVEIKRSETL